MNQIDENDERGEDDEEQLDYNFDTDVEICEQEDS